MQDDAFDQVDHIGVDLWFAARLYERVMFERLAAQGFEDLTVADSEILVAIPASGARSTEVAKTRRVTKQAAQEQIKSLIARGYLRMEPDPEDGRAKRLVHTDKGQMMRETLAGIKRSMQADLVNLLGPEQMSSTRDALGKVRAHLAPGSDPPET